MNLNNFKKAVYLDREAAELGSSLIAINNLAMELAAQNMDIKVSFNTKNFDRMSKSHGEGDNSEPQQMMGGVVMMDPRMLFGGMDPNQQKEMPEDKTRWFALSAEEGLMMMAALKDIKKAKLQEIREKFIELGIEVPE